MYYMLKSIYKKSFIAMCTPSIFSKRSCFENTQKSNLWQLFQVIISEKGHLL